MLYFHLKKNITNTNTKWSQLIMVILIIEQVDNFKPNNKFFKNNNISQERDIIAFFTW